VDRVEDVGGCVRGTVAVIGAGYAGLAAAIELTRRGAAVTLFEANKTPGGRARRVEYRDALLDNGQHLLLGAYRATLALMREVGVPLRAYRREPLTLRIAGALDLVAPRLPAPFNLAAALLFARGLSWRDRYGALRFALALRFASGAALEELTVTALLDRHGQTEAARRLLWEPLCVAALNTPPRIASARVFARVLRDALFRRRADSDLVLPAVDLSALFPDHALTWLGERGAEIVPGRRITRLAREGGKWIVHSPEGVRTFDRLLCATGAHEAAVLLADAPGCDELAVRLGTIAHEPIATVYLQYDTRVRLPFAMMGLTGGHVQWVFDRDALSGNHGLLAAVISASGPHRELDGDVLGTIVHREIDAAFGPLPAPRWSKVITEKRATFACTPDVFRPNGDTPAPGLFLAGDYTEGPYPATLEGAVTSGQRAAGLVLQSLAIA
jgi:hydroxysqualene dehydroxylase